MGGRDGKTEHEQNKKKKHQENRATPVVAPKQRKQTLCLPATTGVKDQSQLTDRTETASRGSSITQKKMRVFVQCTPLCQDASNVSAGVVSVVVADRTHG